MTSKRGRCLCGQVTFEYSGKENWRGHCHCDSCRRNTSSPFTTFFAVPKVACTFGGAPLATFSSSPGVTRYFCSHCGTPMAYESTRFPDEIHFYAASLEDSSGFAADRHYHFREKVPWIDLADDLPKHQG